MTRQNPADPEPAGARSEVTEEEIRRRANWKARPRDWADAAAQARTGDDPRAVAPRDRVGKPSTGEAL
jgi:hypothetical protein